MPGIEKIRKRRRIRTRLPERAYKSALRLGGVYVLPNGKELIVGVGRQGHYFLYSLRLWQTRAWILSLPIEYEIDASGRLTNGVGQLGYWRIEDLVDTGRTI